MSDLTGMPPVLGEALGKLSRERREAFLPHLHGGTSAEFLSDWLGRAGVPVSATTIKRYRRTLQGGDVVEQRRAA